MANYVTYHLHTEDSLLDSCTNYKLYCDKAAELGQTAIAFTEHGNIYNHIEKKMYANKLGLKYIHGVEIYLTATLDFKVRDNYHTILLAKNYEGVKEINKLVDLSTQPDHMYYKPRISFDEFLNISDNVITTSACLASPLNKFPANLSHGMYTEGREPTEEELHKYSLIYDKLCEKYDYYEIQPHVNSEDQKWFNQYLYNLSFKFHKPLIAATDTHSLNQYKADCRSILQKAKGIEFTDEDTFDLTYKSYDELVEMFRKQGVLPMDVVLEAIENTNRLADMIEDYELDTSFKYPTLYEDEDAVFVERIRTMYRDKLANGVIKPDPRYEENIREELRVFRKIGMVGFMLFMSELVSWCWDNGIPVGFCRGSVGGSTIAYITGITDVDPIVWGTVFSRFANEDRMELGDIDIDISPSQRHLVYEHIIDEFGADKTAYVLAITTVADRGTIDEIGRALNYSLDEVDEIKDQYTQYTKAIADYNEKIEKYKTIEGYENSQSLKRSVRRFEGEKHNTEEQFKHLKEVEYPELFYYFDGLNGTAIAQSIHPAGIIVSPVTLPDNYGTFWAKDGKRVLCINMDEIHEVSLVKYDILGLKNIEVIKDTCELAGIPYPKADKVNWNDKEVWAHITDSPVGIFQFESSYAYENLKKFGCTCINDLSLVNASLRPSGETYREDLLSHKPHKNPSEIIDKLLESNHGYLVFQEDTIKFLTNICGLSGSEADNVRRAIGRKQKDRLEAALPSILEGYCSKSDKPREQAEAEAEAFLQIIEDSANYQFGYNHSTGYSMIGYLCGYLRYYYPKEFITAYLNNANNDDDIRQGTNLAGFYKIPIHGIKFRHSTANYSCDETGIYKGISAVKYLSDAAANDLYAMRDEQLADFVDLLVRLEDTCIDSRQLEILIKLDFFSEFGSIDYLLPICDLFDKFYGIKQVKKEKILSEGIDFDIVRKYAAKETPKMFTGMDGVGLIRELAQDIPEGETTLKTLVKYQLECLGYIDIVDKRYKGMCVVTELDTKYTPRLTLYPLANGNPLTVKINEQIFKRDPLQCGDIIKVIDSCQKNKMKKSGSKWTKLEEKEWWVTKYERC